MKGFTQAREPMLSWSPFKPERKDRSSPGTDECRSRNQLVLHVPQTNVFQCQKRMFHPGLADLFEALGVVRAAAHAIQILRNDRVIGVRQWKPIDWLVAVVTRVVPIASPTEFQRSIKLCHVFDISNNNIRTRHKVWHSGADCMLHWRHDHRFRFAVDDLVDLDRLHRRADGNCSGQ